LGFSVADLGFASPIRGDSFFYRVDYRGRDRGTNSRRVPRRRTSPTHLGDFRFRDCHRRERFRDCYRRETFSSGRPIRGRLGIIVADSGFASAIRGDFFSFRPRLLPPRDSLYCMLN